MRGYARIQRRLELIVRLSETWFHRLDTPNRLVLDVTRRCNLRCEMCRTWERDAAHELTPAEIAELCRALPRLTWLDVTGGELFLRRDAESVLQAVLDNTPALRVLHFPTNGWFGDRVVRACERVLESRPEVQLIVTVSIDGPREVHDKIRGVKGSFDRALDTFHKLRSIELLNVYVGTTVSTSNEHELERLFERLQREVAGFEAHEWHFNVLQRSAHFFNNDGPGVPGSPARPDLMLDRIKARRVPRSMVDFMELLFLVNQEFYRRGEETGIVCQALRSTCFVSPEGDVHPCHVYDRPLGNIRERTITEIWHAAATRAAREDIKQLACGGCFTPCEAYPALAGAPVATAVQTAKRTLKLLRSPPTSLATAGACQRVS